MHEVFAVDIIESERGWGRKVDDTLYSIDEEVIKEFTKEYNSKNTKSTTPEWYMIAENIRKEKVDSRTYDYLLAVGKAYASELGSTTIFPVDKIVNKMDELKSISTEKNDQFFIPRYSTPSYDHPLMHLQEKVIEDLKISMEKGKFDIFKNILDKRNISVVFRKDVNGNLQDVSRYFGTDSSEVWFYRNKIPVVRFYGFDTKIESNSVISSFQYLEL